MKYIKKYESWGKVDTINKQLYWILPTDDRLEDAIIKVIKLYIEMTKELYKLSDIQIEMEMKIVFEHIEKMIKESNPKGSMMILSLLYSIDKLENKIILGPSFNIWDISQEEGLKSSGFIKMGYINFEEYEIDAEKYNL